MNAPNYCAERPRPTCAKYTLEVYSVHLLTRAPGGLLVLLEYPAEWSARVARAVFANAPVCAGRAYFCGSL